VYHTGTVNASSLTVGTSTVANTTGVYTGVVNGSSLTVGSSTIANSTGVYTGVVNGSSITVGTSTIANSTGVYTGVVNGSSLTVGTSTIANATGVYTTGTVNSTSYTIGSNFTVNTSTLYFSGNVQIGAGLRANGSYGSNNQVLISSGSGAYWGSFAIDTTQQFTFSNTVTFTNTTSFVAITANGSVGNNGQYLASDGTKSYWATPGVINVNTAAQYTWSNTQTFTNTITFNSTIVGTVNNALNLGGTAASGYQTTAGLSGNVATLTSNNATNLNGQPASYYTNATNINTGTLAWAQAPTNTVNTSGAFTYTGISTHSANVNINATLVVNGTVSTAKANIQSQTLSDGATISWDTSLGQIATVTLAGNRTVAAPTNLKIGTYLLHVYQDATGGRTLTWNSVFKWTAAVAPPLTSAANAHDVFTFVSDGTNLYGSFIPDVR